MADRIPIVRQRRLAQARRELRPEAGLTQDAVAGPDGLAHLETAVRLTGLTGNAPPPHGVATHSRKSRDSYPRK